MPENDFEKKVSSELQELRFKPSDTVWIKVEERIRKKKRRRVFVILFLMAAIALTGYWMRGDLFGKEEVKVKVEDKVEVKVEDEDEVKVEDEDEVEEGKNKILEKDDQTLEREAERVRETSQTKINKVNKQNKVTRSQGPVARFENKTAIADNSNKKRVDDKKDIPSISKKTILADEKKDLKKVADPTEDDRAKLTIDEPAVAPDTTEAKDKTDDTVFQKIISGDSTVNMIKTDSLVKNGQIKKDSILKNTDSLLKVIDSPVVRLPKRSVDKKWKWGAQFVPGISFLNENGFAFSMNKSADALSYQSPSAGSGAPAVRQKPSEVKPGFAFQLGGFLQRQLGNSTDLSLGLQYGFYSTRLGIGRSRDTLLRYANQFSSLQDANAVYNAGGDTMHYTNRYHFIEMPFRFSWQLNKNVEWPISWYTGVSISYLFATNALMYDTAFNGIYYQNKKMLNKTQVSLSTGFSFTIANNRKLQLGLGPFMNFHMNKLVDNPFERKKYLFFTGVKTSVIFNR